MRFSTKLVLSLLAIIPSSLQDGCSNIGGTCRDAQYSCDYNEYPVSGNYCPGGYQCCVVSRSAACEQNYKLGECMKVLDCLYMGGSTVTGICPGPSDIKCCHFPNF